MRFKNGLGFCLFLLSLAHSPLAVAAAPPQVKSEILALLAQLEASACDFNRNGKWYSGDKARHHLMRKLEYIDKRGDLESAEQFIELAATESSFTGKPYQVRCGASEPIPSKTWLLQKVQNLRQAQTSPFKNSN